MTEQQLTELFARLEDMHGMQVGLMQVLALTLATTPADGRAIMKTFLPKMDEQFAAIHLNSGYSDRILSTAEATYRQLTAPLR